MFEGMKKEKEEGSATEPTGGGETTSQGEKREEAAAKPQNTRSSETLLRKLNSYSSLLNVVTLMSLTWHLVHSGQQLHTVC